MPQYPMERPRAVWRTRGSVSVAMMLFTRWSEIREPYYKAAPAYRQANDTRLGLNLKQLRTMGLAEYGLKGTHTRNGPFEVA